MKKELHRGFILRVERGAAGTKIPFDKVYFLRKEDESSFPRIFKNAMVFPISKQLGEQVHSVVASGGKKTKLKALSFARANEKSLRRTVAEDNSLENILEHRNKYKALVPVLFTHRGSKILPGQRRCRRRKHSIFPAYLIARPTQQDTVAKLKRILTASSYFIFNGKVVRPICLMCPRHQYWLQGECYIGDADCYEHLAQAKQNDLVLGVKRYQHYTKRIDEPTVDGMEE